MTNDAKGGSGLKGEADKGWYTITKSAFFENRASLGMVASGPLDLSQLDRDEKGNNLDTSLSSVEQSVENDKAERQP